MFHSTNVQQVAQVSPHLSISPAFFTTFGKYEGECNSRSISVNSKDNLKDNQHNGFLSINAQKRLKKTIGWFLLKVHNKYRTKRKPKPIISNKIAFLTLTLPSTQKHTDNEIKSILLNQFLIELGVKYRVSNYIWRAEKQKNGNLHFHILVDKYLPWFDVRQMWNRIVEKLGYVSDFEKKNGHRDPNSTDIHALNNVKNVYAYISKYCSKNEGEIGVEGRLWFASSSLSNIENITTEIDFQLHFELERLIEMYNPKVLTDQYFQVFLLPLGFIDLSPFPCLHSLLNEHCLLYDLGSLN